MKSPRIYLAGLALVAGLVGLYLSIDTFSENRAMAAAPSAREPMLAHMVYFSLAEPSAENRQKLINACQKWLTGHPGTAFFGVGTPAEGLDREVNDRNWDVGLHLVFENRQAHDEYQESERHQQFIEENKSLWNKVRVFDADLVPAPTK